MRDFVFKVDLVAIVRVRTVDENVARKVVPTVLGVPGTADIRLANEANSFLDASVTNVNFFAEEGSIKRTELDVAPEVSETVGGFAGAKGRTEVTCPRDFGPANT